jgi:hypothetical protein
MYSLALTRDVRMSFLMLDYFSRVYFVGMLLAAISSVSILFRFVVGIRSLNVMVPASVAATYSALERMNRSLDSLFCLSVVLAVGCFANQILGVSRVYMVDRFTDANPVFALDEAWFVSQSLICVLLLMHIGRWYASSRLDRHRARALAKANPLA